MRAHISKNNGSSNNLPCYPPVINLNIRHAINWSLSPHTH